MSDALKELLLNLSLVMHRGMRHPYPAPDQLARDELRQEAEAMIAEAACTGSPKVFSATGHARDNISIVHQQIRCANLAWALAETGRVRAGSVVAIIGGSFSGLMLAASLALVDGAVVYLFEKEARLMPRFRDKAHRYVSPVLNSRALGPWFDPHWSEPHFRSPVFQWHADWAHEVSAAWLREFEQLASRLPIFPITSCAIGPELITEGGDDLEIRFAEAACPGTIKADLLIDATGYGEERNPLGLADHSYWASGHRLIYDHLPPNAAVLISGCGDSGVIEALSYALEDFRHDQVKALWAYYRGLEAGIDEGLVRARFDEVLKSPEIDRYDPPILSELCWWLDTWGRIDSIGADAWWSTAPEGARSIFEAIDAALQTPLATRFGARDLSTLGYDEREDFIQALTLADQLSVRETVRPLVDEQVSLAMSAMADSLSDEPVPDYLGVELRTTTRIVLNDLTPTAYTRSLSPYNVWPMRQLLGLPNVHYLKGRIVEVRRRPDQRFDVEFADGAIEIFDRVVSRYGYGSDRPRIVRAKLRDTQAGDYLLRRPTYSGPDPLGSGRFKSVEPARRRVIDALWELDGRAIDPHVPAYSKQRYIERMMSGERGWPDDDPLKADPQAALVNALRRGVRPRYDIDAYHDAADRRR